MTSPNYCKFMLMCQTGCTCRIIFRFLRSENVMTFYKRMCFWALRLSTSRLQVPLKYLSNWWDRCDHCKVYCAVRGKMQCHHKETCTTLYVSSQSPFNALSNSSALSTSLQARGSWPGSSGQKFICETESALENITEENHNFNQMKSGRFVMFVWNVLASFNKNCSDMIQFNSSHISAFKAQ